MSDVVSRVTDSMSSGGTPLLVLSYSSLIPKGRAARRVPWPLHAPIRRPGTRWPQLAAHAAAAHATFAPLTADLRRLYCLCCLRARRPMLRVRRCST